MPKPSRLPFRAALVAASTVTVAALVVALPTPPDESPDAWPSMGTVPVVTDAPPSSLPYRPEPRPTSHTTRAGERATLTPSPTESIAKPAATPSRTRAIPTAPADIRITFYRDCTGHAQSCIDDGHLTMYGGQILAGHNYMGYQWLSRVAVGRTVRVIDGPLSGTYRVYDHMRINRQGGAIPDFGRAALVLQTCEGSGTGFSLLERVK
ncbi:hypothetical protein NPS70_16240 [Streptomyces sp. C10-9-1]|uniref:hypothetical protein n=1 Tax=Streptomyces sp. C10-9-1 TaxID=1859285 RepID=UPI0021122953|nr:hypothetical protein [Streptomyces sp. C10-9-1]MCQ6554736.1 hypothetical protein [Streptomyces sp. C10-9-1]